MKNLLTKLAALAPVAIAAGLTAMASQAEAATIIIDANSDSYVQSGMPNTNFGSNILIRVGSAYDPAPNPPGVIGTKRGFIGFDLSAIPANAQIENVEFRVFQTDTISLTNGFEVFSLDEDWNESTITWNNQPLAGGSLGTMTLVANGISTFGDPDLTQLVQNWVTGTKQNFGLTFRVLDESANSLSTGTLGDTFASKERGDLPPPQIVIELASVPEPDTTLGLLTLGTLGAGCVLKRKLKQRQ